jgi:hypothetical protein
MVGQLFHRDEEVSEIGGFSVRYDELISVPAITSDGPVVAFQCQQDIIDTLINTYYIIWYNVNRKFVVTS